MTTSLSDFLKKFIDNNITNRSFIYKNKRVTLIKNIDPDVFKLKIYDEFSEKYLCEYSHNLKCPLHNSYSSLYTLIYALCISHGVFSDEKIYII